MRTVTIACFVAVAFAAFVTAAPSDTKAIGVYNCELPPRVDVGQLRAAMKLKLATANLTAEEAKMWDGIINDIEVLITCMLNSLGSFHEVLCRHGIDHNTINKFLDLFKLVNTLCGEIIQIVQNSDNLDLIALIPVIGKVIECYNCGTECWEIIKYCFQYFDNIVVEVCNEIWSNLVICIEGFLEKCPFWPLSSTSSENSSGLSCSGTAIQQLVRLFVQHPNEWAQVSKEVEQATSANKLIGKVTMGAARVAKSNQDRVQLLTKAAQVSKERAEKTITFAAMLGAGVGIDAKTFEGIQKQVRMCVA